jgi:hypothetical protein
MDRWGPNGCRKRIGVIVRRLAHEADKQDWFDEPGPQAGRRRLRWWKFLSAIPGREAAIRQLVLHACRLAERDAKRQGEKGPSITVRDSASVSTDPVDVVYALGTGSRWQNNELRYSLRSLEKYALDLGRVFVVGEKPPWLTGVVHVPMKDKRHTNKDANIIDKVRAAIAAGVSERFIFASDDQALLSPVRLADLPAYAGGDLAAKPDESWPKWKWWQRMRATRDYLVSKGLPAIYYDTHVFQPHSSAEFERISAESPYTEGNGFCINTLILNQCSGVVPQRVGRAKSSHYGRRGNLQTVRADCDAKGRIHLGYNDAGLRHGLKEFFAERFPDKSRFETSDIPRDQVGNPRYRGRIFVNGSEMLILEEELEAVVEAIPEHGRFLEIGSYHGVTASLVAQRRPNATIVCVDPFRKPGSDAHWHKNKQPNMTLMKGTVDDLLATNPEPFDVALIDGDHRKHPCYRDLWACERLVKADGLRIAHDFRKVPQTHVTGKRGVQRAVSVFRRRYHYKIEKVVGSLAFLVRSHGG